MKQLKGFILGFAVLLAITCLYQLSFTVVSGSVERSAEEWAQRFVKPAPTGLSVSDRQAYEDSVNQVLKSYKRYYLDSVQNLKVYGIYTYKSAKEKSLGLGLDLKGGMSLVMEIAEDDVLRNLSGNNTSESFNKAVTKALDWQKSEQQDFLSLFQRAYEEIEPNGKLATIFASNESYQGKINFNSSNAEVIRVLRSDFDAAISNTYQVLKTRIDQFGVASANITLQQNTGRIILELPGVDDPTRIRKLLQQTARLEFWKTYENNEIYPYLDQANALLKDLESQKKDSGEKSADSVSAAPSAAAQLLGSDSTVLAKKDTARKDTGNINPLFDVFRPNVFQDGQQYKLGDGPVVGMCLGKDTSKVMELLSKEEVKAIFPRDLKLLWGAKPFGDNNVYSLFAIRTNPGSDEPDLSGDVITDARQSYDQSGVPSCDLEMNQQGAIKWEKLTEEAANSTVEGRSVKKCIAIVLDEKVFSAPRVQGKISGGRSNITGIDDLQEAVDLANILKSGKLEARTRVIEEQIIGPSLGKEAIRAGITSLIVAFVVVFLLMIGYYSTSGFVANTAMILNLFVIIGVLASIPGTTLTLPGMAGIVLTLAIAVDANVIINERIREELARGKGLRLAVEDGYKHSYSAILDGNIVTFIMGSILLSFGLGPVKGFAVILVIGILCSLFTAVLLSHFIFDWWLARDGKPSFGNSFSNNLFKGVQFDFMGKKKVFYAISALLMIVSFVSMFTLGFDKGVDFQGGRSYVLRFDKEVTTAEVAAAVEKEIPGVPLVKTYGSANQVQVTTAYLIENNNPETDSIIESKLLKATESFYSSPVTFDEFRNKRIKSSMRVEATVADDIRDSAFSAGILGTLLIFSYIFIRFRKWQFGFGAVVALIHDPIIVLGVFSLFKKVMPFPLEIDQAVVAAILTLMGYSLNDTVVVFDRIREYMGLYPNKDLDQTVNDSVNSVLGRTIMTSVTTFLVSLVLLIFGGDSIRSFSFALMLGIAIGTYSSIFVASPVTIDLLKRQKSK